MMKYLLRGLFVASPLLLLAGCVTEPPAESVVTRTPTQMLAAVQQAGKRIDDRELDVQPLRDTEVEDLRDMASAEMQRGDANAAAATLDTVLKIVPDDPAVLQERAEAALALGEFDRAEQLALQATGLGSAVGPWCRRHWETAHQVRERRREIAAAPLHRPNEEKLAAQSRALADLDRDISDAQQKRDACTVPGINRM